LERNATLNLVVSESDSDRQGLLVWTPDGFAFELAGLKSEIAYHAIHAFPNQLCDCLLGFSLRHHPNPWRFPRHLSAAA
jgi:hypothetical protein